MHIRIYFVRSVHWGRSIHRISYTQNPFDSQDIFVQLCRIEKKESLTKDSIEMTFPIATLVFFHCFRAYVIDAAPVSYNKGQKITEANQQFLLLIAIYV